MKFELHTTGFFYTAEDAKKLESLGFKFEKNEGSFKKTRPFMKSSEHDDPSIEISTLEELMDFIKKWGEIVLDDNKIEIYDDYRE